MALLTGCSLDAEGNRVFGGPGFGNSGLYAPKSPVDLKDRSDAISKLLIGKDLTPIEGIWVWPDGTNEVAIVRNRWDINPGFDFVGFITDTQDTGWKPGEIKFLLKETAEKSIFTVLYFGMGRTEHRSLLIQVKPNIISVTLPTGPFGYEREQLLIRAYPKDDSLAVGKHSERAMGSGFFVSPTIVVTNFHVVQKATRITISRAGSTVEAELLLKDSSNDLALLKTVPNLLSDSMGHRKLQGAVQCLQLRDSALFLAGEKVFTLGYPLSSILANSVSVGEGIVNNTAGIDNDPRIFQISIPIQPGNSGSPLLDSQGQVVGVVTSTLDNTFLFRATGSLPQNVNFAIKSSYLRNILSMVPDAECPTSSGLHGGPLTGKDIQERLSSAVVQISVTR